MKTLSRLSKLDRAEIALLGRTLMMLWLVRLGLWVLPYDKLCQLLFSRGHVIAAGPTHASVSQIVRMVKALSRYIPAATCLTKALVTKVLLDRLGQPANLQIGVTKSSAGNLEAHAWVELDGKVVIGGRHREISRYTVLRPV